MTSLKKILKKALQSGRTVIKSGYQYHPREEGKSGGARVITYISIVETQVYLLTIYDKSEKEDLNPKELKEFLSQIP